MEEIDKSAEAAEAAAAPDEPAQPETGAPVSVAEAKAIFSERPDVAAVLTVDGTLHRDGTLT